MRETGLEPLEITDPTGERSERSKVLIRIAQSLQVPVEAFYGPPRLGLNGGGTDIQTEKLLALVKAHLGNLDPCARRRFGEAIRGMIGPDPTND